MPRVFSSQIEDAQQPASNQTGEGGDNENSSADEGPDDGAESGSGAGSDHRAWCRGSKRQQCGQPRPTTSIFIGERCFFCSPFCCSSKKKTRWRHSAAPERGANSKKGCGGTVQIPAMMKSWSRSLWAAGAQQASRCLFHSSAYRSQARRTVRKLDFSPKVDFQQRLYPQHYCPVHIGKAMFLSLPSENCADRCASHHVHRWSSHCAKPCGGQGQVPHSSGKVVGCNCCQTCSDEQRITASGARPRLTYQKNRRCVEEFRSTHDSPGAIENLNHWCYSWRCRSYILVEFLHKIIGCIVVHYSRKQHNLAKVRWKLDS